MQDTEANWLIFRKLNVLQLERNGERRELPISAAFESNEGQVICAAGRSGMGIVIQPLYLIHDDIVAGRLATVLEDWRLAPLTINLAYQSRRHLPAKIRAFADAMREYVRSSNLEARWNTDCGSGVRISSVR